MPREEALSSRERVALALEHQETDRIPISMICSGINPPAFEALEKCLQDERGISVAEYLEPLIDTKMIIPQYIGPPLDPNEDIWGVRRKPVSYGSGSYDEISFYPLARAQTSVDLDDHRWPVTEWFDYSIIPARIAATQAHREYCLISANGNIFETSWYMLGFQQMFVDMILKPDLVHAIMARVTDFYVEHFAKILTAAEGGIDLVFTADDLAGQGGLLMSRGMWEEFIKPYHTRLNAEIHGFDGVKVIYHSDGNVTDVVDGLIDMGIDVLQALQFSTELDPVALKQLHGDRLCFEGGVSVQTTLPFGTAQDVEDEVRQLITVLGKGGGYILGPSHAIQAGTPPENIVAMFDTAATFYPF
ncbi:MAG: uroporphyrinogen decarboxylase family protein [Anaerolineae bacterium]|nr:uroporphyrinogen decarboxylase family protein [Anaerolineae bacterium]